MGIGYYLKLERFEGPLDLLLHLIKVNEIDIFQIDIFVLTTQYLEHLRVMEFDDLSHAGEFIEMAATLIEIKTRQLLPQTDQPGDVGDDEVEDPLKDLQKRLLDYETFRAASQFFAACPQVGVEIHTSHEWQRLSDSFSGVEGPLRGDPVSMVFLYEQVLKDFTERKPEIVHEAVTHRVGIAETIDKMIALLETVKFAVFQSLYKDFKSRYELIIHIMSVLEMSARGQAKLYQETVKGPLWVYKKDFEEALLPVKRNQNSIEVIHEAN